MVCITVQNQPPSPCTAYGETTVIPRMMQRSTHLKALVVKNSVLHDFGFGKVSQIHKTFLMELQLFGWRHFSKTEVVQNTVLNH